MNLVKNPTGGNMRFCSIVCATIVFFTSLASSASAEIKKEGYVVEDVSPTRDAWEANWGMWCHDHGLKPDQCRQIFWLDPTLEIGSFPPEARKVIEEFFEKEIVGTDGKVNPTTLMRNVYTALRLNGMTSYYDLYSKLSNFPDGGVAAFTMVVEPTTNWRNEFRRRQLVFMVRWKATE